MTLDDAIALMMDAFDFDHESIDPSATSTFHFTVAETTFLYFMVSPDDAHGVLITALPNINGTDPAVLQKVLEASCQGRCVGSGSIGYDGYGSVALLTPVHLQKTTEARFKRTLEEHLHYVAHLREMELHANAPSDADPEEIIMVP